MDYIISILLVVVVYGFTIYHYGKERKRLLREKEAAKRQQSEGPTEVTEKTPDKEEKQDKIPENNNG